MPRLPLLEILLALGVSCCHSAAQRSSLTRKDVDLYSSVIYRIEGGRGTKFPFGVKCHQHTYNEARRICQNTITHAYTDWRRSPNGPFYSYLADRYCPPSVDPIGNERWKKNFRSLLNKTNKQKKNEN